MKNRLLYTKRAKCFEEALPLGNGRIGAMVFGNTKRERIALNEDTLWSGFPKDKNKKDAFKFLPEIRQNIFANNFEAAQKSLNKNMCGDWSESYLPFGDLIIEYFDKIKGKNYKRELDLQHGIATVKQGDFRQEVFVSFPAQLLFVHIKKASGISCRISLQSKLKYKCMPEGKSLVMSGRAPEVCRPPYYNVKNPVIYGKNGMTFSAVAVCDTDADYTDGGIIVKNKKEFTVVISLATSYIDFKTMPSADSLKRAKEYLNNFKCYEKAKNEHAADFSALFSRVDFELESADFENIPTDKRLSLYQRGNEDKNLIALLFQYGRYLKIAGSRQGSQALNLQGIWNEDLRAPWSSNYTININTQMNYWGTDLVNLSECFEPLADLAEKIACNGQKTAKDYYACAGFCAHHNTDIWGCTQPASDPQGKGDSSSYAFWQSGGVWILNMLCAHMKYDKSAEYENRVKELCRAGLEFYKDFLIRHSGELVTCPSISPENSFYFEKKGYSLTYMPSMDREILTEFFANCRDFGFDVPKVNLPTPAPDGRIPEWSENYKETEIHHRHISHLYCVYPSVLPLSGEMKKAAKKSLDIRGDDGTGWSLAWKLCCRAALGDSEGAMRLIKNQLRLVKKRKINLNPHGGTYPNLFCAHPPFQIDGNFGFTAGVAEMIVRGAMPGDWNGKIKGLKLRNGKEINSKIKNGVLTEEA